MLSPGADERAFRFCFRCRKAAEDSAGEDTVAETTTPSELGFLTNVSALPDLLVDRHPCTGRAADTVSLERKGAEGLSTAG